MALRGVWNGAPALCHGVPTIADILRAGLSLNFLAAWTAQIDLRVTDNGKTEITSRGQAILFSLIGTMKTDRMAFPTIRELLRKSRTASFTPLRVILATPAGRNNILSDIMKSSVTVSLPIKTRNKNRNRLYNRRFQYIYYIFAT